MAVSPTSPTSASKTPSPSERGTTRTPAPAPRIDARYPGEGRCPQPQTCLKAEDMESVLLDAAGHRCSPATMPGYHHGRAPRNKGLRYPTDPPTIEEIVAVMRAAGEGAAGSRLRALIVILWRAGLRISEALDLAETDLDRLRGAILVRRGKGDRRREVGMDRWAWDQLQPWLEIRAQLPVWCLAVRHPRRDRRPSLGTLGCSQAAAPNRSDRWSSASIRAAPAAACARSRDGARRCSASRHPTPARTRQPRHHLRLPAGHRQRGDHPHRPLTPSASDLSLGRPG